MPASKEIGASRAALLELRREREVIEQGHRFLDEKRMQLARELLRRIDEFESLLEELADGEAAAAEALQAAVESYGLADLQVYPAATVERAEWSGDDVRFLGLNLPEAGLELTLAGPVVDPAIERPPAARVADRHARIAEIAARGAAMLTAMMKLDAEYRRTERSVRALENVVLPEVREQERLTDDALAELEQEEAVRIRLFARTDD